MELSRCNLNELLHSNTSGNSNVISADIEITVKEYMGITITTITTTTTTTITITTIIASITTNLVIL
jgi:hypothetical protein